MLLLEGIHLHVAGFRALAGRRGTAVKLVDGTLLAAHIIGYLAALFLVLSPLQAVVFLVIQQGLFGVYLGCSFAPNHKGMPVLGEDEKIDFLRRQVITSRNIRGGWFTDFALGGLNYQIEHHLFPSMPRPSLRHAQERARSASSTASPTGRPASSPPTGRSCGTCTPSAVRCGPSWSTERRSPRAAASGPGMCQCGRSSAG